MMELDLVGEDGRAVQRPAVDALYRCPGCGLSAGADDFRLGRIRRLSDPDIKAKLDAERAAMTPESARKWLLDGGFITERGELSERYGGPATASGIPHADTPPE